MKTRLIWLCVLGLCLAACPPPIDTGDGGDLNTVTVGPAGGIFIRNGYGLNVPAGAFDEDVQIFVTIVDTNIPEVPDRKRISLGYRLSPAAAIPKQTLTMFIPWIEERTIAGVAPDSYDMRRQQGADAYLALPGAKTNLDPVKWVEAKTDKLGLFWVTSPNKPNIARLEIDPGEASLNIGGTQQFTARVVSPTGESVESAVNWKVVPGRVGTIDQSGLFTARDPGVATVTASSGDKSASAKVYVQGTTVGPVTYLHENPFPTGNDLWGGAFAPAGLGTVYAGGNGTVLIEDATGQFSRAFSTPGATFHAVGGTSLNDAVAIGDSNGAGVMVEFKGANAAPFARVFQPNAIQNLVSLWFDGTHGMGVGAGNQVVIRRDGGWTTEYHPSFEQLLSVIGDGAGGFTVVGDLGSIYTWDPARAVWDSLYDRKLSVKLDAAQLVDATTGEAWAVGANQLWHFQNNAWSAENLPASPMLAKATAIGVFDQHVFVGGSQRLVDPLPAALGAVLIRSLAGLDGGVPAADAGIDDGGAVPPAPGAWSAQQLRGQQVPRGFFGAGTEGRMVGDLGAVWNWNHATATFSERSAGFQGDVADIAVTTADLYAAVNECVDVRCARRTGVVMHRSAGGFAPLGTLPTSEPLTAIVARTDSEVLAASTTHVWLWSGAGWTQLATGSLSAPMLDLAWCNGELWGASGAGEIYRGSTISFALSSSLAPGPLHSLHCPTPTELWVAGTEFLASRQLVGNGQTWTQATSMDISQGPWQSVWSPGTQEAFAFGDALFGVYFNTAELALVQSTGPVAIDVSTAMWGDRIDNLYMTGLTKLPSVFGFLLRYDGINWTLVDSGASRKGTALIGKSTNEIWLGTEGGGVLKAVAP